MAGDLDASRSGDEITREHSKDRALARAVGTEQADDLALLDGKRNVRYRAARPVPLRYMLRQHNWRHQNSQDPNAGSKLAELASEQDPGREARNPRPFTRRRCRALTRKIRESACAP